MDELIKEERSSEEEVLKALLLKNLFLREAGEGDSSTRPRQTTTRSDPRRRSMFRPKLISFYGIDKTA